MTLLDVRPMSPGSGSTDRLRRNAIALGQRSQSDPARAFQAYCAYRVLREPGASVSLSAEHLGRVDALRVLIASQGAMPTLAIAVARVHGGSSKEEVVRAHTGRVVAMVADAQVCGRLAEVERPRHPMRELPARGATRAAIEQAIAARVAMAGPFPTAFGSRHLAPEALFSGRSDLRGSRAANGTEPTAALIPDRSFHRRTATFTGVDQRAHVAIVPRCTA